MARKILVVLTSHGKLGNTGEPTGWYLPELAHPYDEFIAAGFEVTTASPKGGESPLDPASVQAFKEDTSSTAFLEKHDAVWRQTAKLADFVGKSSEFDALFYPGGHGPMFDLATDADSIKLAAEFADAGKIVAAVCHGPAALINVRVAGGELLLKGREVAGFSNEEETIALGDKISAMPFSLEDKLNEASGGKYVKADKPWGVRVAVAGKVITGQNPASSKGVGEAIIKAVQGST